MATFSFGWVRVRLVEEDLSQLAIGLSILVEQQQGQAEPGAGDGPRTVRLRGELNDPQESSDVVAALFDPALSDLVGQPVAQADPSASGTATRRWFRSDEPPALAQNHADSPAVARLGD